MVATFNAGLTDDISKVRQFIGDTAVASADFQDETIMAYLARTTVLRTASQLAYDLSAKYARLGDVTVDDQRNNYSKITIRFKELGDELLKQAIIEEGRIAAGASGYGAVIVTGVGDCRGPMDDCCRWPAG